MDLDSVCGMLLGLTPAFQQYNVHVCHIKAQEIALFCREDLYSTPGNILLHGRLLHNQVDGFCFPLREVVGLGASFPMV